MPYLSAGFEKELFYDSMRSVHIQVSKYDATNAEHKMFYIRINKVSLGAGLTRITSHVISSSAGQLRSPRVKKMLGRQS